MTKQIIAAVKKAYETQGRPRPGCFCDCRSAKWRRALGQQLPSLRKAAERTDGGFHRRREWHRQNHDLGQARALRFKSQRQTALLAACDTFRAAAIEQLKLWGQRLKVDGDCRRLRRRSCRRRARRASPRRKRATPIIFSSIPPAACTPSTI